MAAIASVNVKVGAEIKEFQKQMIVVQRQFAAMSQNLQQVSNQIRNNISLPFAAAAGAGVKFAMDLETELVKINTLVGTSGTAFAEMRKSINEVSAATGKARAELAQAAFVIQSAGVKGAESLQLLEASAKASVVGLGEQKELARAATAMMQAYGTENINAAKSMDLLTAVVREGNMEASELAPAIGKVLPVAKALGVSFEEVGANIAVFTRLGVSASESVSAVQSALASFLKPSEQAKKAVEEMGLSFNKLRQQLATEGLAAVMNTLLQATNGNIEALGHIIPRIEGLSNVLGTAGAQGDAYAQVLNNIRNSTGLVDNGFKMASQGSAFQFQKTMNDLRNVAIQLGETLMPVFQKIAGAVQRAVASFQALEKAQQENVIKVTALVAASPILLSALSSITGALSSFAGIIVKSVIPGIGKMVAAVAAGSPLMIGLLAVGATLGLVVYYWDDFKSGVERATGSIAAFVNENQQVRNALSGVHQSLAVVGHVALAVNRTIYEMGRQITGVLGGLLTFNWQMVEDTMNTSSANITAAWSNLGSNITQEIEKIEMHWNTHEFGAITADSIQAGVDRMMQPFRELKNFIDNLFSGGSSPIAQIEADATTAAPAMRKLTMETERFGQIAPGLLLGMRTAMAEITTGIDDMRVQWAAAWQDMMQHTEFAISNMVGDLLSGMAMMATSGNDINQVMAGINLQLANMMENLGKAAIHKGIIEGMLSSLFVSPGAAIAAGVGALLFAGVLRGQANKRTGGSIPAFANGALVYGPQLALVGDNTNAARDPEVISPLSKLQGIINKGNGGGVTQVYGRLQGSDLYISNERTRYTIRRTTGRG
jgi:TP901 family phage tail tape measure protein